MKIDRTPNIGSVDSGIKKKVPMGNNSGRTCIKSHSFSKSKKSRTSREWLRNPTDQQFWNPTDHIFWDGPGRHLKILIFQKISQGRRPRQIRGNPSHTLPYDHKLPNVALGATAQYHITWFTLHKVLHCIEIHGEFCNGLLFTSYPFLCEKKQKTLSSHNLKKNISSGSHITSALTFVIRILVSLVGKWCFLRFLMVPVRLNECWRRESTVEPLTCMHWLLILKWWVSNGQLAARRWNMAEW